MSLSQHEKTDKEAEIYRKGFDFFLCVLPLTLILITITTWKEGETLLLRMNDLSVNRRLGLR